MQNRKDAHIKTVILMIDLYCREHQHDRLKNKNSLCIDCQKINEYSILKLDKCKFGENKPVCSKCNVHCYEPGMREEIRKIMRYSGPRMLLEHPIIALKHIYQKLRY